MRPTAGRWRGCLFRVLGVVLGLGLALLVAELAARVLYPPAPGEVQVLTLNFGDPNPWAGEVGWGPRPHSTRRMILPGQYDTLYDVNSLGLRGPEITYEKPPGIFRVLLIGDSYVEAIQVAFEEAIAQQLEALLNARSEGRCQVIGVGTSGWGTANAYLYYHHEGVRFDPDLVVYVFIHNDPADNAPHLYEPGQRQLGPYFTLEEGGAGLVLHPSTLASGEEAFGSDLVRWLDRTFRERSRLYALLRDVFLWPLVTGTPNIRIEGAPSAEDAPAPGAAATEVAGATEEAGLEDGAPDEVEAGESAPLDPRAAEAWEITRRILALWAGEAAGDSVRLVVLDVPRVRPGVDDPAHRIAQRELGPLLNTLDVPFRSMLDAYRAYEGPPLFGPLDPHWNENGHRFTAQALYDFLDEEGLLP